MLKGIRALVEDKEFWKSLLSFLRPRFHNRMTLTIVIFGFSLIGNSVALTLLDAYLGIKYSLSLFGKWDPVFGIGLILVALVYNAFVNYLELFASRKHSDQERLILSLEQGIFEKLDGFCDERQLVRFLDGLANNHHYFSSGVYPLDYLRGYLHSVESHFVTTELDELKIQLLRDLNNLDEFLGSNFFVFGSAGGEDARFCLQPGWNVDRGGSGNLDEMRKYDQLGRKLLELVNSSGNSYREFRKKIREKIFV